MPAQLTPRQRCAGSGVGKKKIIMVYNGTDRMTIAHVDVNDGSLI